MGVAHWHILGAGAIGSLLATQLLDRNLAVTLLHRDAAAAAAAPAELQRRSGDRSVTYKLNRQEAHEAGPIAALLVTTKANDALAAFLTVADRLSPGAPVILLHNGLGIYEQIINYHPAAATYCGITTEGAYLDEHKRLIHAGAGITTLGQHGKTLPPEQLRALLEPAGCWQWDPNIEESLWRKLLINCAINPLTASNNCANGDLLKLPELREQTFKLVAELEAVSRAAGFIAVANDLQQRVSDVISKTAANTSSMLQDQRRGRPTEIDHITGFLCRQAQQLGIAVPNNEHLWQLIRKGQAT